MAKKPKLVVYISEATGLPVMDKGSQSSDPYVEVKFGKSGIQWQKTNICQKTLHPIWNSKFKFEVTTHKKFQEPLEIKVMDQNHVVADDMIGMIYIDLNCLLLRNAPPNIKGWFPIFDTLRGIRGHLLLSISLQIPNQAGMSSMSFVGASFNATNTPSSTINLKESSVSLNNVFQENSTLLSSSQYVQFFSISCAMEGYYIKRIIGFVEELVVEDDPEYHWADPFRYSRDTNERRQRLLYHISGKVKRKIGLSVVELGGNAVLGFSQNYDFAEGGGGIVARAIGTCVILAPLSEKKPKKKTKRRERKRTKNSNANLNNSSNNNNNISNISNINITSDSNAFNQSSKNLPVIPSSSNLLMEDQIGIINIQQGEIDYNVDKRGYDQDIDVSDEGENEIGIEYEEEMLRFDKHFTDVSVKILTLTEIPPSLQYQICGIVSARAVKIMKNEHRRRNRDKWWTSLRRAIQESAHSLKCNVVFGYSESTSIFNDVMILSATGTACKIHSTRKIKQPPIISAVPTFSVSSTSKPTLSKTNITHASFSNLNNSGNNNNGGGNANMSSASLLNNNNNNNATSPIAINLVNINNSSFNSSSSLDEYNSSGTNYLNASSGLSPNSPLRKLKKKRKKRKPGAELEESESLTETEEKEFGVTTTTTTTTTSNNNISSISSNNIINQLQSLNMSSASLPVIFSSDRSRKYRGCSKYHVPYLDTLPDDDFEGPFPKLKLVQCQTCKAGVVPEVLLSTTHLPPLPKKIQRKLRKDANESNAEMSMNMMMETDPPSRILRESLTGIKECGILQARVCRPIKRADNKEQFATAISENLTFLEFDLHSQLKTKLAMMKANGCFGLKYQITISASFLSAIATATAVRIKEIPPPPPPAPLTVYPPSFSSSINADLLGTSPPSELPFDDIIMKKKKKKEISSSSSTSQSSPIVGIDTPLYPPHLSFSTIQNQLKWKAGGENELMAILLKFRNNSGVSSSSSTQPSNIANVNSNDIDFSSLFQYLFAALSFHMIEKGKTEMEGVDIDIRMTNEREIQLLITGLTFLPPSSFFLKLINNNIALTSTPLSARGGGGGGGSNPQLPLLNVDINSISAIQWKVGQKPTPDLVKYKGKFYKYIKSKSGSSRLEVSSLNYKISYSSCEFYIFNNNKQFSSYQLISSSGGSYSNNNSSSGSLGGSDNIPQLIIDNDSGGNDSNESINISTTDNNNNTTLAADNNININTSFMSPRGDNNNIKDDENSNAMQSVAAEYLPFNNSIYNNSSGNQNVNSNNIITISPLSYIPFNTLDYRLTCVIPVGRVNLHFVRENRGQNYLKHISHSSSLENQKKNITHENIANIFLSEALSIMRCHVAALGGNYVLGFKVEYFFMTAENKKKQEESKNDEKEKEKEAEKERKCYCFLSISGDACYVK